MKRIAVVTDHSGSVLGDFLRNNLLEIFGGFVDVALHSFDELRLGDQIEGDAVMVMLPAKMLAVKPFVTDSRRVLSVRRTLKERAVFRLFDIPAGSRVLIVNDTQETTLETVALLYQLGLDHLQLEPFIPGMDLTGIQIAVTPAEAARVPSEIETVIDVGHRCIDLSSFLQVISRLGLEEAEIDQRLIRYAETIVTLDTGIKEQYKAIYLKNLSLDTVVNLSTEGVLLLDREKKIRICNERLRTMLSCPPGQSVVDSSQLPDVVQALLERAEIIDEICEWNGHILLVNKRQLQQFGEAAGTYLQFQEVTYIRQLEQTLQNRLRSKGMVARYQFNDLLTASGKMMELLKQATRMASSELTVLISGESGTGKELLAQSIHNQSTRAKQPFVAVNCAALPESLLESELFGYEAGAFTGALREGKAGLFEQANYGTIFLDEIGDMPCALQARLLRVLQERQVMRVGSQRLIDIDIRVIAATNQELRQKLASGEFRADLYYRLNVLPICMPPLRERCEDVLLLLEHFLKQHGRSEIRLTAEAAAQLQKYQWPGNIRELANAAAYLSFVAGSVIEKADLPHYMLDTRIEADETSLIPLRDRAAASAVLTVLSELDSGARGAGRLQIERLLKQRNTELSESEIRRILLLLGRVGLVETGRGRGGSRITKIGLDFINRSTNR